MLLYALYAVPGVLSAVLYTLRRFDSADSVIAFLFTVSLYSVLELMYHAYNGDLNRHGTSDIQYLAFILLVLYLPLVYILCMSQKVSTSGLKTQVLLSVMVIFTWIYFK